MKLITVITICYNAADVLPLTIESVLAQDHDNYEYVIEDGESTDDTPAIIEKYRKRFESKGISFIYNRKPDGGIYDAMNKGVEASSGNYINFMNAGDCFYASDVLGRIEETIRSHEEEKGSAPDIVYGDCAVYEYGRFYMFNKSLENIMQSMPFSHQSAFARRELLISHPFKTHYRYSADYDFLLTAHDSGQTFSDAGISTVGQLAKGGLPVVFRVLKELSEMDGIAKSIAVKLLKTLSVSVSSGMELPRKIGEQKDRVVAKARILEEKLAEKKKKETVN